MDFKIEDYLSYVELLPHQFEDSENLKEFLTIFLEEAAQLRTSLKDLDQFSTNIDEAFGYQLDIIGKLLGVDRDGRNDTEYRKAIRLDISLNAGSGTPDDLILFLKSVTGNSNVKYWEHYPACVVIETTSNGNPSDIARQLDEVAVAGVKIGGVMYTSGNTIWRPSDEAINGLNYTDLDFQSVECAGQNAECGNVEAEAEEEAMVISEGYVIPENNQQLLESIIPSEKDLRLTIAYTGSSIMYTGGEMAYTGVAEDLINATGIMPSIRDLES